MASGNFKIDLRQKMNAIFSGYFLRAFVCFSCDALRREPRSGMRTSRRPPCRPCVSRIGPWRGLAGANVQQIIGAWVHVPFASGMRRISMQKLQKTHTAAAAPTRQETRGVKLFDCTQKPESCMIYGMILRHMAVHNTREKKRQKFSSLVTF